MNTHQRSWGRGREDSDHPNSIQLSSCEELVLQRTHEASAARVAPSPASPLVSGAGPLRKVGLQPRRPAGLFPTPQLPGPRPPGPPGLRPGQGTGGRRVGARPPATYRRRPEWGAAAERAAGGAGDSEPAPGPATLAPASGSLSAACRGAEGGRAVRLGPARGRVCSRAPGSVLARVRGAPRAPRRLVWARQVRRGAGTLPIPASPGRPARSFVPHPGRGPPSAPGRGAGAALWEAGPPRGGPGRRDKSAAAWRLAGASRCL